MNLVYLVIWWRTILYPPQLLRVQAIMWVFFLVNLLLHHLRALLMMCQDSFGIFWLRKQQYPKEMLFHLANKIVARKTNCVLEKRQMEREFVLPPQQGMWIFCSLYFLKACIKGICGKYPKYTRSLQMLVFQMHSSFFFFLCFGSFIYFFSRQEYKDHLFMRMLSHPQQRLRSSIIFTLFYIDWLLTSSFNL